MGLIYTLEPHKIQLNTTLSAEKMFLPRLYHCWQTCYTAVTTAKQRYQPKKALF